MDAKQAEINESTPSSKPSSVMQWVATFSVFMLNLQLGIGVGWSSPNNAQLLMEDSPIRATPSEISWLTAVVTIGAVAGAILGGLFIEYLGTRRSILTTLMLMAISWLCLLCANSMAWLFVSRSVFGLCMPLLFCCFSLYLGEISDPRIRGTLIALSVIGTPVGTVGGIITETYLPMKVTSSIYLAMAIMNLLLNFWLDETPYYLMKRGNVEAARISLSFYRGVSTDEELKEIANFVENSEGIKDKLKKMMDPTVRKTLLVVILVFALPQLSGYMSVFFYMEIILKRAKFVAFQPEECVIYANIITVVSAFLSFQLPDKLGRRVLLIISSIGTAISMFALGLHFHLLKIGVPAEKLQWLPVVAIMVFLIAYPIGYGSVPGVLLSELFPENVKSVAVCISTLVASFSGFLVVIAYQWIVESFGDAYAYWIHSILAMLGVPCALFLIVETKGKTFQEIQDKLNKK